MGNQNKSETAPMAQKKSSDLELAQSHEGEKLKAENDDLRKRLDEMIGTPQNMGVNENEAQAQDDHKVEKSERRRGDVVLRGGDATTMRASEVVEMEQVVAAQTKMAEALAKDERNNKEVSKLLAANTKLLKELTHKLGAWNKVLISHLSSLILISIRNLISTRSQFQFHVLNSHQVVCVSFPIY